jgi:hypothetical protein
MAEYEGWNAGELSKQADVFWQAKHAVDRRNGVYDSPGAAESRTTATSAGDGKDVKIFLFLIGGAVLIIKVLEWISAFFAWIGNLLGF